MEIMRKNMVRSKPKERENGSETLHFPGAEVGCHLAAQVATFFTPLVPPSDRSELRCLVKRVG